MDGIVGFLVALVAIMVVALPVQILQFKRGFRAMSGGVSTSWMPNRVF
jgi:hypothetical protein